MDLNELKVYQFSNKTRMGNNGDGGYVFGVLEHGYDAYFSCGIANEESFTKDFLNTYSLPKDNCYAFDGTIADYPYHYTDKINFVKKNIGSESNESYTNLNEYSLPYNNIFMKMDIEGGEFSWLLSTSENILQKFKQIVIEYHGINDDSWNHHLFQKLDCIRKLNNTHYIIHAHGNNFSQKTNNIPDVLEITYVRKDYFLQNLELNKNPLPIPNIDFPNCNDYTDLDLNFFPFVN
jgi:hypothetical protein